MARSISGLCHAAIERCEEAKRLTGEERRTYLADGIRLLFSALDLFAENEDKRRRAPVIPFSPRREGAARHG